MAWLEGEGVAWPESLSRELQFKLFQHAEEPTHLQLRRDASFSDLF
jgi:hypothetical protein